MPLIDETLVDDSGVDPDTNFSYAIETGITPRLNVVYSFNRGVWWVDGYPDVTYDTYAAAVSKAEKLYSGA